MRNRRAGARIAVACALWLMAAQMPATGRAQAASSAGRPLTVDDVLATETLNDVAASPDGEWIAAVVNRGAISRGMPSHEFYGRQSDVFGLSERADIWLVSRRTGERRNLTNGRTDGSGAFHPVWSPDGARLAFLWNRGAGADTPTPAMAHPNLYPYVWDRATGTVTRLSTRGVSVSVWDHSAGQVPMLRWVDIATILLSFLPDGAFADQLRGDQRGAAVAAEEWEKARRGIESTASRLESGLEGGVERGASPVPRATSQLVLLNVVKGGETVVPDAQPVVSQDLTFTRDGRQAASSEPLGALPQPKAGQRLQDDALSWGRVRLLTFGMRPLVREFTAVPPADVDRWMRGGKWSPNGRMFAAFGKRSPVDPGATHLWVVDGTTGVAQRVMPDTLRATAIAWTGDNRLLAYMIPPSAAPRADWFLVHPGSALRNVTARLTHVPSNLEIGFAPNAMIGVTDGAAWSIDVDRGTERSLTAGVTSDVESIVWSAVRDGGSTTNAEHETEIVVEADVTQAETSVLYRITWSATQPHSVPVVTRIPKPQPAARLTGYNPSHDLTLFQRTDAQGTSLWSGRLTRSAGEGTAPTPFSAVLKLNEYLAGITLGRDTLITYVGIDGDSLRALVTLPVGYQPGRRYPVVLNVYAGSVYRDTVVHPTIVELAIPLHMQLFAAHGYVVLQPSIPIPDRGDVAIDLTKGVMPALDKLIEIGIADPNRAAVFGHSFGGYTTYALVAYTHRFKAAIASAGAADLVSIYGTLSAKTRYRSDAMDDPEAMLWSEYGQVGMGVSPSENLWRYLRNSPVLFADRISTPLLIIQGDQDFEPITQGEEMFSALYRQGKRARFVRYWGEGHVVSSPANIRDLWKEIYEWLDTYVGPHT